MGHCRLLDLIHCRLLHPATDVGVRLSRTGSAGTAPQPRCADACNARYNGHSVACASNPMTQKRVLVFIVAYNAEKTIQSVIRRIDPGLTKNATEILIID